MTRKTVLIAGTAMALASLAAFAATATSARTQDSGQQYSADTVSIENFIGRIEVRTGTGSQVSVAITNPGGIADNPTLQQSGTRLSIDGGQSVRNLNCRTRNGELRIGRRWSTQHAIADYPLLTITAPADIALSLNDSAYQGTAGALGTLDLDMDSCGDFEAGAVARNVSININGSGDVRLASIGGAADVHINGSGDVTTGDVAGGVDVGINGSGDVRMADVGGNVEIGINGSGDVGFDSIAGLDVQISGSGDVRAEHMDGPFNVRIGGSGDVSVASGRAEPFGVNIMGSGDVSFGGTAVDVTVRESGSGDVRIETIEGRVDWRRNGRSVLQVNGAN